MGFSFIPVDRTNYSKRGMMKCKWDVTAKQTQLEKEPCGAASQLTQAGGLVDSCHLSFSREENLVVAKALGRLHQILPAVLIRPNHSEATSLRPVPNEFVYLI